MRSMNVLSVAGGDGMDGMEWRRLRAGNGIPTWFCFPSSFLLFLLFYFDFVYLFFFVFFFIVLSIYIHLIQATLSL